MTADNSFLDWTDDPIMFVDRNEPGDFRALSNLLAAL